MHKALSWPLIRPETREQLRYCIPSARAASIAHRHLRTKYSSLLIYLFEDPRNSMQTLPMNPSST